MKMLKWSKSHPLLPLVFISGIWANKKSPKTEFKSFIDSLLQGANLQDRSKF